MRNGSKNKPIPVNTPVVSRKARRNAADCLQTGWLSSAGPYVSKFERAFADFSGTRYAACVSSGTAALHLALKALGIGKGDEVIVPAFTMIASVFAVLYTGARPVFVDCELETFNMDSEQIERKIGRKTRAIMAVHLFGHPCEMDAILRLARRHHLKVVEDAAQAHGAYYRDRPCGSMGDISCFSFYANKIITTGEGGMVVTNQPGLYNRVRRFRDLCHSDKKRFVHDDLGYNYRLTNLQAAVGLGELEHAEEYIERKIAIAAHYTKRLSKIPGIRPPVTRPYVRNVFWMYAILIDPKKFGMSKDALRKALAKRGIDTRDLFYPPDRQPVLRKYLGRTGHYKNAAFAARNGCYLPSGLALTAHEIDRVCEAVESLHSRRR